MIKIYDTHVLDGGISRARRQEKVDRRQVEDG